MKKFIWFLIGLISVEFIREIRIKRAKKFPYGYAQKKTFKNTTPLLNEVKFVSKKITTSTPVENWKRFLKEEPVILAIFGVVIGFTMFHSGLEKVATYFQASTIQWEQQAEPFNGAVYPIEKVADWVALTDQERTMTFDQLSDSKKINIPEYNLNTMKKGMVWKRDNGYERNCYITYPVPNLGNYQLDATENTGSHTGIDIKTLVGTPVRAISRGVVIKSENQPTGFGQHIVVMHIDVPDPENPGKTTTLYSAYAHLSTRLVRVGDKVEKGQIIGKTGMSGMATAPHLHFQVDRADAPFLPYWPFTWKDLQASNINSYFEAVKVGINKNRAAQFTVHPIDLITSNINFSPDLLVVSSDPTFVPQPTQTESRPAKTTVIKSTPTTTTKQSKTQIQRSSRKINDSTATIINKQTYTERKLSNGRRTRLQAGENIRIETDRNFRPGRSETFDIVVTDEFLVATAGIELSTTLRDRVEIKPEILTKEHFKDGVAQVEVTTDSEAPYKLVATGENFNEVRSKSLRAQTFNDVESYNANKDAIEYVQQEKIMNGYSDGSFKPEGEVNRAEAVKILIAANDISVLPAESIFLDVENHAWYAPYISTALARGLVKGYDDGTFRPGNTISRAEFLKVAIEAAQIPVPTRIIANYNNIPSDAWYAPYFAVAYEENLLTAQKGGNIAPHTIITREEAAQVIWKLNSIN